MGAFDCDEVIETGGREPIAVDQPPHGGDQYPFVGESDLKQLLADLYLSYKDDACQFVRPFRIQWVNGIGCDGAPDEPGPEQYGLLIVDANDVEVVNTVNADDVESVDWGDKLRIVQWTHTEWILRTVIFGSWDPDLTPVEFPVYIEPESAVLDERTCERRLPNVTSLRVPLGSSLTESITLKNGFNTELEVEVVEPVDGGRRQTIITVNAGAGDGRGVFPADCADAGSSIRFINQISADESGNFTLDAGGCHRIERPIFEMLKDVPYRAVAILDHTLQIFNDCSPCCTCGDFINTYEGIRRLRNKYAELFERANALRTLYLANLDRFQAQRDCRVNDPLRLTARPLCPNELALAIGFCNNTGRCIENLVMPISFTYSDGAGDLDENGDPLTFSSTYSGGVPIIPPNNTFRAGNTPSNPEGGGGALIPELFELGGSYPHYYAYWERVSPGAFASTTIRVLLPGSDPADLMQIGIDAYEGPGDLGSTPGLTIPIPGYTPGVGPVDQAAKDRRLTARMKVVQTGLLQSCATSSDSASESA